MKKNNIAFIMLLLAIALTAFGALSSISLVGTRERGVVTKFGAVTGKIFNPGLNFKVPFLEGVTKIDVGIQKQESNVSAASKDLQSVKSIVALNYSVNPLMVTDIVRLIGSDFEARIIIPSLQESVKAATSQFAAEELITKRVLVRDKIKENLKSKLETKGIQVDEFNIIDFEFSPSFNAAIEAKVTAEQNALAAKNKLEQIKYEAEQKVVEAKGKAEAIRVESEALENKPQILQLRAIEKWTGNFPTYYGGGALPFLNIK
jgi:prohibitin 2